jgi:hypothetical protein
MVERLQRYVLVDHKARWKNDLISMAIATFWYLLSLASGIEGARAFRVSMGMLAAATVIFTLLYVFRPPRTTAPIFGMEIPKRILLAQLALACLVLVLVRFCTPVAEVAIVDTRLRKALEGEPTKGKIEEAAKIVTQARAHDLNASPILVSRLGAEVLRSTTKPGLEETALGAASLFASYRSNLSPTPKVQYQQASIGPGPVSIRIACMGPSAPTFRVEVKGISDIETALPETPHFSGFGGYARVEFPGCSRTVIESVGQQQMPLTGVRARNITFSEAAFYYDGGPLKLESVQFIRCTFTVPTTYAGNQNIERLLAAVMTGQPVSLENFTFGGK